MMLVIHLLEKIYSAENNELDWLDVHLIRFGGCPEGLDATTYTMIEAISTLYKTYDLDTYSKRGIYYYIRKYDGLYESLCDILDD